jgi:ATP-dependent Clp protease ATP-binding subunit ClpA
MFERFTDRARRVLVLAQTEASNLGHNFLGTEHILMGLLAEKEGIGARALTELGASLDDIRAKVQATVGPSGEGVTGQPPFTPRAKTVLEMALREALTLGHNYIGTEHLLLGLLREGEGLAAQVLVAQGISLGLAREKVLSLLGTPHAGSAAGATTSGARLVALAVAVAQGEPIGSHHYLLAMLRDERSLANRVLGALGVTSEAVRTRIDELGFAGTDDQMKPPFTATATGGEVVIRIEDAAMAERVRRGELVVTFREPDAPAPAARATPAPPPASAAPSNEPAPPDAPEADAANET